MPRAHEYDNDFDTMCNLCFEHREVILPLQVSNTYICEDVDGICWEVAVTGLKGISLINETEAVYDNATINGHKLISMGAIIANNYAELGRVPHLEDVDGRRAVDVPAKYLFDVNDAEETAKFNIRVINIPDEHKNREIDLLTYIIFEDKDGNEETLYCNSVYNSYN